MEVSPTPGGVRQQNRILGTTGHSQTRLDGFEASHRSATGAQRATELAGDERLPDVRTRTDDDDPHGLR